MTSSSRRIVNHDATIRVARELDIKKVGVNDGLPSEF